jgi:hypothetical protein
MARATKSAKMPKEDEFDLIKSNYFRVIHADGVVGGLSPNGNIHMALYSERRAIPTKMVHPLEGAVRLGPEIRSKRQGRTAVVREVEADIVISVEHAIRLHKWLGEKIEEYKRLVGDGQASDKSKPNAAGAQET